MAMSQMSHDELFAVFTGLTAKVIYRFKCLNKSISKIFEEPHFALKQSQNMLAKDYDSCFFIRSYSNEQIEFHSLEPSSSGISDDVLKFLSKSVRILGSSNGLILCRRVHKLFICNPATKSWVSIPFLGQLLEHLDPDLVLQCFHDDYSIFLFEEPSNLEWFSHFKVCKVYKCKEGVWETMERNFFTGGRNMKFNMPIFHNGALHFISDCSPYYLKTSRYFKPYIMSCNLESGMSTMIRIPKEARRGSHDSSCDMSIFKWRGKVVSSSFDLSSICLVRLRKYVFTVWILLDYNTGFWKRILKMRVRAILEAREKDPKVTGFTVMNGGFLIFATEKGIYSYGLVEEKYMMIEEISQQSHLNEGCIMFTPYMDTLRSCGIGAATMPCHSLSKS